MDFYEVEVGHMKNDFMDLIIDKKVWNYYALEDWASNFWPLKGGGHFFKIHWIYGDQTKEDSVDGDVGCLVIYKSSIIRFINSFGHLTSIMTVVVKFRAKSFFT